MYLGVGVCIVVASNTTIPLFSNKYFGISQCASKHFVFWGVAWQHELLWFLILLLNEKLLGFEKGTS